MLPRLTPPTVSGYVSSAWGASRAYRGGWHNGLDFPDAPGAPVLAAAAGRVSRVDNYDNSYAGRWVTIDHGGGASTVYMHNQQNLVSEGDRVRRGQRIGLAGATGTKSGSVHVHFALALQPTALLEYERRFGKPTTGWGSRVSSGTYVPAEALMSGATYKPRAKRLSESKGVAFYAGVSLATLALVGFVGWGVWELTR